MPVAYFHGAKFPFRWACQSGEALLRGKPRVRGLTPGLVAAFDEQGSGCQSWMNSGNSSDGSSPLTTGIRGRGCLARTWSCGLVIGLMNAHR